jgi:hypothetical protein
VIGTILLPENVYSDVHKESGPLFSHIIKSDQLPAFLYNTDGESPPGDLCRATVYYNKNKVICAGYGSIRPIKEITADTFTLKLQSASPAERWCFSYLVMEDDGLILAPAIQHGEAIAVCDGSFLETYGTAVWVVGVNSTGRASGSGGGTGIR